jgi:type III restriction enzyme
MKLQFKIQKFQTDAVQAVVDCFAGQQKMSGLAYRVDPGLGPKNLMGNIQMITGATTGLKNDDIQLSDAQLLANIQKVQGQQNLPISAALSKSKISGVNLDVEMETGTGKTYCYLKTMFELYEHYGWRKFIIVVPSIAIREGVAKSLAITAEHFLETYQKKIRFFVYNSKQLHQLESFSSNAGINAMVINVQAFNVTDKYNRRIYEELDDFQSRRPIDVISANRPILILDEPQKLEGGKTLNSLVHFKPLMVLRYSATHRTTHNQIHRLDALDAYNKKLVKKIAVRGIAVRGLAGTSPYCYLESIEISKQAPVARMEIEVRQGNGIKRIVKRLGKGDNLHVQSKELAQYRGFVIAEIDARENTVAFTNGEVLHAGDAFGDITEETRRRIQIREAIRAHFEKEAVLFAQGIKVLSLFFIDEVKKYRDYEQADAKGVYAHVFEAEYQQVCDEYIERLPLDGNGKAYREYLKNMAVARTHNGYFSVDTTGRLIDTKVRKRGENAGEPVDENAYDLILKDKERLLSLEEPTRFIFSHSALREGWDNPNVFVMCMLKNSDNTISRRQEVGRGLRLSVNRYGERMDHPATVHDVNVLTVVASESYHDFVKNLQREIKDAVAARPRKADEAYFADKTIDTKAGTVTITNDQAKDIEFYLIQNGYVDRDRQIVSKYHEAKAAGELEALPDDLAPYAEQIFKLIDNVFSESQLPDIGDDRRPKMNPLNDNFARKEFLALWERINKKSVYRVEFNSSEFVQKCIPVLNKELRVTQLTYTVQKGEQRNEATYEQLQAGQSFVVRETSNEYASSAHSGVKYDLLGKITEQTQLTRKTVAEILTGMETVVFKQFKENPEHFIAECVRIIEEQKGAVVIEKLSYDSTDETYDTSIFTAGQHQQDFARASEKLKKHIYDYVIADSAVEKSFAEALDASSEVVVYAKLPRGFLIPTPVGDYNPDWAISFAEGKVKHVYFVAETKGSNSSLQLRLAESQKIDCARKFFERLGRTAGSEQVKYSVVKNFGDLMDIVGKRSAPTP